MRNIYRHPIQHIPKGKWIWSLAVPGTIFLVSLLFASTTLASSSPSQTIYYGCVDKTSNILSIGSASNDCPNGATKISWNQVGPQGPAGPQGAVGPKGSTGPAGPQGVVGSKGSTGPAGPQGAVGPKGSIGPAGPKGSEGPQGPKGSIGPSGPQGPKGAQGPAGPQGQGGATGPKGSDGSKGSDGPQGPEGPQGPAGPQGPQGSDGAVGPDGPEGAAGPAGISNGVAFINNTAVQVTTTATPVLQTDIVPAGSYIINATISLSVAANDTITCNVGSNSETGGALVISGPFSSATSTNLAITDSLVLASTGTLDVMCSSQEGSGTSSLNTSLTAIQLDTIQVPAPITVSHQSRNMTTHK